MISKNISLNEATRSSTAKRYGIDNSPNAFQFENMRMVAEKCFQPLREWYGEPLFISSFLRSKELNEHPAVNGSTTSQHLQGLYTEMQEGAMDIDADVFDNGISNTEVFHWLVDNVEFDQAIYEYPDKTGKPSWVHISYRKGANRGMELIAFKNKEGRSKYVPYTADNLQKIIDSYEK
jgi:hypothetical protein